MKRDPGRSKQKEYCLEINRRSEVGKYFKSKRNDGDIKGFERDWEAWTPGRNDLMYDWSQGSPEKKTRSMAQSKHQNQNTRKQFLKFKTNEQPWITHWKNTSYTRKINLGWLTLRQSEMKLWNWKAKENKILQTFRLKNKQTKNMSLRKEMCQVSLGLLTALRSTRRLYRCIYKGGKVSPEHCIQRTWPSVVEAAERPPLHRGTASKSRHWVILQGDWPAQPHAALRARGVQKGAGPSPRKEEGLSGEWLFFSKLFISEKF